MNKKNNSTIPSKYNNVNKNPIIKAKILQSKITIENN